MKKKKIKCTGNDCGNQTTQQKLETSKKRVARVRIAMLLFGVVLLFYFFHALSDFRKGQALKDNIQKLYLELIDFKNDPDFIKYGFDPEYKYNKWKSQVRNLIRNPIYKKLINNNAIPDASLFELGLSYYASEGKESKFSKSANKKYKELIKELKQEKE